MKPSLILLICLSGSTLFAQQPSTSEGSAAVINKAVSLHDEGKYKEAIQLYASISRNDTNYVWALYEMGMSLEADSQQLLAKSTYETALKFSQNQEWEREADILTNYGSLMDDLQQPELALTIFDRGIKKFPEHRLLRLNKATTLLKIDRFKEAEQVLKELLLMSPYTYSAHYLLGLAALNQGKIAEAFISFNGYLMVTPTGRYQGKAINFLSMIANNKQELESVMDKKEDTDNNELNTVQQILLSKIALNENYKPLSKIDDVICRQIQVVIEKMEYNESSENFWIQYYGPLYKKILNEGRFEPFINHCFSNVNIPLIQDYVKKEKKKIQDFIEIASTYFNGILYSRELEYPKRASTKIRYHYEKNEFYGKGQTSADGKNPIGYWEYYYNKGNLKSKGSYNNAGERYGTWTYYHSNGLYEGVENFENGKLNGVAEMFYDNGNPSYKTQYEHGIQTGVKKSSFYMGTPKLEEHYNAGQLVGSRKIYFNNGDIHFIENYQADSLDGIYKAFYRNGQVEYEQTYKNGKVNGSAKGYHKNGQLQFSGQYNNNTPIDTIKRYHPNGVIKTIEPYQNGVLQGDLIEFHPNGVIYYKCPYKNGVAEGMVEYFSRRNKRYSRLEFKNNKVISAEYFNAQNEIVQKSIATDKGLDFYRYDETGLLNANIRYDAAGVQQGKETYYYTNGQAASINYYKDGELTDTSRSYYLNGKETAFMPYLNGKRDGIFKQYYPDGKIKEEGSYINGSAEGVWKEYDITGKLKTEIAYSNDNLHGFTVEYWLNGKPSTEKWYQFGWLMTITEYDSLGNQLGHIDFTKGNGTMLLHHPNGKIYQKVAYQNGFNQGKQETYFFDGKPESTIYYRQGLTDSIYVRYDWNGNVNTVGQFKNGEKYGTWKYYTEEGKLSYEENYQNDELHGVSTYYYSKTGAIYSKINYQHEKREGWTTQYDSAGRIMFSLQFEDDHAVAYSYQDPSNKPVAPIPISGGNARITTYYSNGKPSSTFEYAGGKLTGEDISYYFSGGIKESRFYVGGLTNGLNKMYYENGKLNSQFTYVYDVLHGAYAKYYPNGALKEEGAYYNNQLHGDQIQYDANGKKKQTKRYYNGLLIDIK